MIDDTDKCMRTDDNQSIMSRDFPNLLGWDQYITFHKKNNLLEDTMNNLIGVDMNIPTPDGMSQVVVRKRSYKKV